MKDAYDSWNYKSQSLNPAVAAVIAVAAAAVTAGTGLAAVAGNTAITAAGVTGTTASAAVYGSAYAGMTSLVSQAAVALVENKGNLSKTLNTLGSSSSVKSLATSMAIGGALAGFDDVMKVSVSPDKARLPVLVKDSDWGTIAQRVAGQSVISSSLNTAINGGSYKDNLVNALLANVGNQRDILAAASGDKAAAKRVQARREAAAMVAITGGGGVALTVGGLTLLGAAPEMVLAARLVVAGCKTNPALCLNQAGIYAADIFASEAAIGAGSLSAGTTLIVGKSRDAVTKLGRQVMVTADEALKNKAFNVQPVAELVKKDVVDSSRLSKKTADYLKENNKIINPATNKVVTEHIVVLSGKAPKTSTPNSVYEVSRVDGSKSITYYDSKGRTFSREDYGQQRTHGSLGYDSNGKVPPHEHKITYNERGFMDKKYYREIDKNGKAVGPWILEK